MTVNSIPTMILGALICFILSDQVRAQSERDEVLSTIQTFFDAMASADTIATRAVLMADGQYYSLRQFGEELVVRRTTNEQYLSDMPHNTDQFLERMWDPEVSITGRLAVVTTRYDFHVNGDFSHCGTDVFNLIRTDDGWKLAGIMYTVESVGCESSPLGMPFEYQGVSGTLPSGSSAISTVGLISAFDMETLLEDGRLKDFGPSANHGRSGDSSGSAGIFGKAWKFDSVSDRIDLPENQTFVIDGSLTLALWIKLDALDLHQHVLACDDRFVIWITPENNVRFSDTQGNGMDTNETLEKGKWYSLVATLDGIQGTTMTDENVKLYLNGVHVPGTLINRQSEKAPVWSPGELYAEDACYIGFESHQGMESHKDMYLDATIDDISIFSRSWSEMEVEVHASRN